MMNVIKTKLKGLPAKNRRAAVGIFVMVGGAGEVWLLAAEFWLLTPQTSSFANSLAARPAPARPQQITQAIGNECFIKLIK
jgi:hypothetical protein